MSERYKIYFEPGIHPIDEGYSDSIKTSFARGDLNASFWNPEVAKRLRTYQPHILGLDSVGANRESRFRELDLVWLPGSPQQIAGRGSIFAVVGDVHYSGILRGFRADYPLKFELDEAENESRNDSIRRGLAEMLIATPVIGALLLISSLDSRTTISRRKFLRSGSLTLGGIMLGLTAGRTSPLIQTFSDESDWNDLLQTITDLTKPFFTQSNWLDGRTALVVAKTKEAMDILDLPDGAKGVVLMGFPHSFRAKALVNNIEIRRGLMFGYAEEMLQTFDKIIDRVGMRNSFPYNDTHDALLTFYCRMDIFNVREPQPTDLTNYPITERVKTRLCKEAVEAVSSLGNPYRYY